MSPASAARWQVEGREVAGVHTPGDGLTLVLIHGAGCNHHFFRPLLAHLGRREVVVPSLPGRCGSSGPPLQRIHRMAAWFSSFIGEAVPGPFVLGGHSMGGGIALSVALDHPPDNLEGLALYATGARLRLLAGVLAKMRAAKKSGAVDDVGEFAYHSTTDPEVVRTAEADRTQTPAQTAMADWLASNSFDRTDDVGRLDLPALIVAARDDPFTPPDYAEYLDARLPHSQLHVLADAGHMFPIERAGEAAELTDSFLAGL